MNVSLSQAGASRMPQASQQLVKLIQLQGLMARFKGGRQIENLRAAMPAELLRCFDRVAGEERGAVAAIAASGACGRCHLMLPSGVVSSLSMERGQIVRCPHCGCFVCSAKDLALAGTTFNRRRKR